jgi:hypothetical protein
MTDHPRFKLVKGPPEKAHRHYNGGRLVDLVFRIVDGWRGSAGAGLVRTAPALHAVDSPMVIHGRVPTVREPGHRRRQGGIAATGALLTAASVLLAAPATAIELDEVTVVTLASDGSWGVATGGSTGEAIAAAVRACRAMARPPTDCGARLTTTRGRWVIANLCGDHPIIVGADTREDAEAAAIEREIQTRLAYVPALPSCRHVLTVDPAGAVAANGPHHSARAKIERLPPR